MKTIPKLIFAQILILISVYSIDARGIFSSTLINNHEYIFVCKNDHLNLHTENEHFSLSTSYQTSGSSGNFDDPNAWIGGIVPPPGSDITIAHNLNLNQNYTASNIVIQTNIEFSMNSNVNLLCQSLSINLDATLIVGSGAVLEVIGNITNDGNMYFKSDGTNGSGQFDEFNGVISGSGETTVERFIPAKRIFRFHSSTLNTTTSINDNWQEGATSASDNPSPGFGTHISGSTSGANGFDQTGTGNPSFFRFDNTFIPSGSQTQNDAYIPLSNTDINTLSAGQPNLLLIRGDRSIDLTNGAATPTNTILRSTGDLHTGNLTFNVGNPMDFLNLNPDFDLYSLVANPYQAVVDYSEVTRDDITDYIYAWDVNLGGSNSAGGYVTIETPSDPNTLIAPNPGLSDLSQFLAPGMPFFIENLDQGSVDITAPFSPTLTFQEDDKRTDEPQVNVYDTYPDFYINSRVYKTIDLQNGNRESDALGLRFHEDFVTMGSEEDATKLFNNRVTYAVVNNGLRSIDKQNIPNIGDEIELYILFDQPEATNYSFTFEIENKPVVGVFLRDNYLNTQVELNDNSVYDFTIDTNIPGSIATDRFDLLFDNSIGFDDNTFGSNFTLYPNPATNGQFNIKIPNLSGEVNLEITSMLGQNVYSEQLLVVSNQVEVNAPNLSKGIYAVKLTQGSQSYNTKLIVE